MTATIKNLLKEGLKNLAKREYNNPQLESELILSHLLNIDRAYLYTYPNHVVDDETSREYEKLIQIRNTSYPLQYILGHQEFMGLDFKVEEGVLVPRPDTEILIEELIELSKNMDKEKINIMDIGTGSGAISLSLAHYINNSYIYSVDISDKAIEIARKNSKNLELEYKIEFINRDILKGFPDINTKLDMLVSNPPYIPTKDLKELSLEVSKYEPKLALDGGEDGLKFYRFISKNGYDILKYNGVLAFEIGYNQGNDVKQLMEKYGYIDIQIIKDLENRNRVVWGRRG
ncbi:peptide chain release factor N(5)-glutamine methyltransferase [Clostridium sp. D2Q-14]|uniref:peptide chain release factor N(5)-glutamine methyltransferase n=1 Tax=Anaeromonas gelatinilytica TaxID=2683194 RepID=UPI00193C7905|nr:peptide chain release factor N(5)-glutamine methyltransferase [Anaeromonas gelatinilytica]MBS4536461.1 peptide chain release factor N(5)-glutamine methyltransferase [Anaeromonas gelatinilytica]